VGINGLPILAIEPDLEHYYLNNVIGGPGAFVVAAQSYETFADAILKKLVIEIAGLTPPLTTHVASVLSLSKDGPALPCRGSTSSPRGRRTID
jgi:hypothetical protein